MITRLCLVLGCLGLFAGCGDDPAPPFASFQWVFGCNIQKGCRGDSLPMEVRNLDGEQAFEVSCALESGSSGNRVFSFDVSSETDDWRVRLANVVSSDAGGAVVRTADVTVEFEGNTYIGGATANGPTLNVCDAGDADCSICNDVSPQCRLNKYVINGSQVTGDVLCVCLPQRANPTTKREVFGADGFNDSAPLSSDPVSFRFENCST